MKLKNKALFLDRDCLINKKWNIDQNKSLMIGDKKIDMIASKKAGLRFIRKRYNLMREVKKKLNLHNVTAK